MFNSHRSCLLTWVLEMEKGYFFNLVTLLSLGEYIMHSFALLAAIKFYPEFSSWIKDCLQSWVK